MARHLPPLTAIRVFEAAARQLNFTRAADELGMTQAAVSYQIKMLEERLGAPLFLRHHREVSLTELGEQLAPETSRAFDILRSAFEKAFAPTHETLTINTMHTFAAQWLAPRMGAFQLLHPGIALRLETTDRLVDFEREPVDIAIRSGHGDWPGLVSVRLFDVRFTPMMSPALADSVGGIRGPRDILKLPLIAPQDIWWQSFFERNQLPMEQLTACTFPSVLIQSLDAEAAMAGHGVALLIPELFEREIADGRLLQPLEHVSDGKAYWLVYPESRRNVPRIRRFREWMENQLGLAAGD